MIIGLVIFVSIPAMTDFLRFVIVIVGNGQSRTTYEHISYFGESQSYGYVKLGLWWGGKVSDRFASLAVDKLEEDEGFTIFAINHGHPLYGFNKHRNMTPRLEEELIDVYNALPEEKWRRKARLLIGDNGNGSEFFKEEVALHKDNDLHIENELKREEYEAFSLWEQHKKYGLEQGYIKHRLDNDADSARYFEETMGDASAEERRGYIEYLYHSTGYDGWAVSNMLRRVYDNMLTDDERYIARNSMRKVLKYSMRSFEWMKRENKGHTDVNFEFLLSELEKHKATDEQRSKSNVQNR